MSRWLDNRARLVALPLLALALGLMMLDYSALARREAPSYRRVLESADGAVGERIALPFVWVRALRPHGMTILTLGRPVEVHGELAGAERGDSVSLVAEVLPAGELRLVRGHVHHHRRLKWLVGATATLVIALLMAWEWWGRRIWRRLRPTPGSGIGRA